MKKKFIMPSNNALAALSQDQVVEMAKRLPDKAEKLALICKWSALKSSRANRAKQAELEANQTATARRTEALRRDQVRQRQDQVKMGRALVSHRRRLDANEQNIVSVAQTAQIQHKKAMRSVGSVVHAMFENQSQIEDEERRSAVRFDYLMRYATKLERDLQETQLVRETEHERVRELEAEMVQMRQEQERSLRLMRELPEFKITRALVLTGQGIKEGINSLFSSRPARVAVAAALIIMMGAAVSQAKIKTGRAETAISQTRH